MSPTGKKQKQKKGERTIYDEIEDQANANQLPVQITDIKSALAAELNKTTSTSSGSSTSAPKFTITEHTIPRRLPPEYSSSPTSGQPGAAGGSKKRRAGEAAAREGTLLSDLDKDKKEKVGKKSGDANNDADDDDDDWEISDLWQSFFFAILLDCLVVVFDVLVFYQYRDSVVVSEIAVRAANSFVPLWLVIYLTHPRNEKPLVQLGFLVAASAGGCWVVHTMNNENVFAFVKRVPQVGALLVWCVIEMNLIPAVVTCAAIGGFTWYNKYSLM